MKRSVISILVLAVLVGTLLLLGCVREKEVQPTPTRPPTTASPAPPPVSTPTTVAAPKATPTAPAPAKPTAAPTTAAAPAKPIKIGALWTFTGPIGPTGTEAMRAIEIFLDEVGGQVAGRKIEVIKEDDAADPKTGLEKARKLVESDKVNILTGIVHSGVSLAIRDYVNSSKVPLVVSGFAGAQQLSFELKSDYIIRTSQINGLNSIAIANYAYDKLGYRKFVVMAEDYAAGHDFANVFMGVIKEKGGQIVQEIYTPYGATDYAAYITQIKPADAVWCFYNVGDAVAFVNQYAEFGMWKRMPLIGVSGLVTPATLGAQRDNVVGIVMGGSSAPFGVWPDKPAYQKFNDTFQKKYGESGGDVAVNAYTGMQVIYKAAEAVNGNVEDALAFLAAAKKLEFEALNSPIRFEAGTNNTIMDVRVVKIEKKDGKMGFSVLETYKGLGPSSIAPYRKK